MIRAAIIFFVIALVAFVLGATGIAGLSMEIGRILVAVFLVLAVTTFLISIISGRKSKGVNFRS
jgi:uncharacterized membrane protein YtjA (UPF0391 family)